MFAQIALPLFLPALTYRVPQGLGLKIGDVVSVPLRKKSIEGIVLSFADKAEENSKYEVKEILGLGQSLPSLSEASIAFVSWCAEYYHCPIGEVLRTFLPPHNSLGSIDQFFSLPVSDEAVATLKGKRQREIYSLCKEPQNLSGGDRTIANKLIKRGLLQVQKIEEELCFDQARLPQGDEPSATDEQSAALSSIRGCLEKRSFSPILLEGITGSGKTEVYLRAARQCLDQGRSVLVIVPEIALTPQLLLRFQSRLGESVAVLHSGITDKERSRYWHGLNRGILKVCVGARSAALAPINNLGLIIVDEEHEGAYKQDDHLRYSARDLAIIRAKQSKATVILGSATPSLESFHNALTGKFKHLILTKRASGLNLPEVIVVDRSKEIKTETMIGPMLKHHIQKCLAANDQVMLLLNRRGLSSFLLCESCGHVPECPHCSVSLTQYSTSSTMKCHYCGHTAKRPKDCQKCGSPELAPGTPGTEALEDELKTMFPGRTVLRIDRESMEKRGALEEALMKVARGDAQIVVGTQMIAKGHDFPNVTLVGVVNADSSFHLPDFRASERCFQLFTQMAGRAGRREKPGLVIIQTYNPLHPSVKYSKNHDFRSFAEEEMQIRQSFRYPPFARLARIIFSHTKENLVIKACAAVNQRIQRLEMASKVEVLGPSPAAIHRIQNRFRWHLILKSSSIHTLHSILNVVDEMARTKDLKIVSIQIDVDPLSLM